MRRLIATALAAVSLAGCGGPRDDSPRVDAAYAVVTLPAAPGRPGAAYFTLEANVPVRLTSVESPRAERIEIHGPQMRRLDSIALEPGKPLTFAPGGHHAMLFGLDPTLRPGESIVLVFRFEGIRPLTVETEVRGPGDVHGGH
jgi:hypothetical protein